MKSQTQQVNAHDKRMAALELRKAGFAYSDIAKRLGVSKTQAHRYVARALRDTVAEVAEDVRTLEAERLDVMQSRLWPQVLQGNHGAVDRVLRVMERRAKLLGLDAPTRTEHSGVDGGAIETKLIFSHTVVAAAIASGSGDDFDALGADESGGDGAAVGQDVYGRGVRADRG